MRDFSDSGDADPGRFDPSLVRNSQRLKRGESRRVSVRADATAGGGVMRAFLRTVWKILCEISDQNAYQRHLRFHRRTHSASEWRVLCDKRLARKYAQSKCC